MVEAARRQRRRRRSRPHGHPRAGGAGPFPGAEAGAPKPPLEARLCGIPPELHGLPRLLQLPPCLVSLGAAIPCLLYGRFAFADGHCCRLDSCPCMLIRS
ncbi:hypothetical protein VPH35_044473 [Triticum aestivum]